MRTIHLDNDNEVNEFIIENLKEENKKLQEKYTQVLEVAQERFYRIDKAIEYINEHIKYECDNVFAGMQFYSHHLYDFKKEDLLDILKGGKNE